MKRDLSLDILRIIACLMVVLMHSPIPSDNATGQFLVALSYLTAPCIGLFFMVSGALLIPVKGDYSSFIRKRLGKVVMPTSFWTAVYIGFNIYNSQSELNIFRMFCSIPFSAQGHGVLWFMYTLIGLYLIAPILSAWLRDAKQSEVEIVLALWGITLCYPMLEYFIDVNGSTTGVLYYFAGYAGYFLLGWYLKNFDSRGLTWIATGFAVSGTILLLAMKRFGIEFDFYRLFWYESIFIAALCVLIWKFVKRYVKTSQDGALSKKLILVSNLSFGIYLIHILIMREWLWKLDVVLNISNYMIQTLVVAVATFAISTITVYFISKLKISKWLIGY